MFAFSGKRMALNEVIDFLISKNIVTFNDKRQIEVYPPGLDYNMSLIVFICHYNAL